MSDRTQAVLAAIDHFINECEIWLRDTSTRSLQFRSGLTDAIWNAIIVCEPVAADYVNMHQRGRRLRRHDASEVHELVAAIQRVDYEFGLYCEGEFQPRNRDPLPRFLAAVRSLLILRCNHEQAVERKRPKTINVAPECQEQLEAEHFASHAMIKRLNGLLACVEQVVDHDAPVHTSESDVVTYLREHPPAAQAAKIFDLPLKSIQRIARKHNIGLDTDGLSREDSTYATANTAAQSDAQYELAVNRNLRGRILSLKAQHLTVAEITIRLSVALRQPISQRRVSEFVRGRNRQQSIISCD